MRNIFLSIFASLLLLSCGGDDGTAPVEKTASELTEEGWTLYTQKNYTTAIQRFGEALVKDANYTDAYNGAGWTSARLDTLPAAVAFFETGLTKDPNGYAMHSGISFTHNALKNYSVSNFYAMNVLNADGNWIFSRDASVTSNDLRVLIAQNYFGLDKYDSSLIYVQTLDAGFTADVGTLEGRRSLAEKIEELETE
ncbi:MAG: hypothetical protein EPO24_10525 [Bacteroidetes bacterium]|nr:MAG: hypothetical protein EPO24_10525 [Bacteroidota bacterium]